MVMPLLRGRVFHVTTEAALDGIRRSGHIHSNQQAQFPFAPQSDNSYGRKRGSVSLFDLSAAEDAYVKEALMRYWFLRAFRVESTHVYLFLSEGACSSLISWKHAARDAEGREGFIPFIEAWYPGDLSLDLISDRLIVTIHPAQ